MSWYAKVKEVFAEHTWLPWVLDLVAKGLVGYAVACGAKATFYQQHLGFARFMDGNCTV